jgi:LPXTG-motif cell wall-anchored protein
MLFNSLRILFLVLVCSLSFSAIGQTGNAQNDKHIKVALRMIGHQILLNSGDSSSLVLPIIEENRNYKIEFDAEFAFLPSELAQTINRIVQETKLAEKYIIEMVNCDSNIVVYSYEVGKAQKSDIIPCGPRLQPNACYTLLFSPLDVLPQPALSQNDTPTKKSTTNIVLLLVGLFVIMGIFFWFLLNKKKTSPNPNLIQLGAFQFDKLNMILLLKEQKIELTSKEADLLLLLYKDVNTTVEKEVLLSSVWGDDGDYVGRTLDVFISKLRKKLEFDPKIKIVNIRGVGYKLIMQEL